MTRYSTDQSRLWEGKPESGEIGGREVVGVIHLPIEDFCSDDLRVT